MKTTMNELLKFCLHTCIQLFLCNLVIAEPSSSPLILDKAAIDLGPIEDFTHIKNVSISYRNITKEKVIIDKVETSCGCTKWNIDKWSLKPGEKGSLELFIDVGKKSGRFQASAAIIAKNAKQGAIVKVTGYAFRPITLSPSEIRLFLVPGEKTVESTALVTIDRTFSNWVIDSFRCSDSAISLSPSSPSKKVEGQKDSKFFQQEWLIKVNVKDLKALPVHFNIEITVSAGSKRL